MKKTALVVIVLCAGGCVSTNLFQLKVNGGSGSGSYRPLETVTVAAYAPPEGAAFDEWTGDVSGMADRAKPTTTIMLDQLRKEIAAAYTNVPVPVPEFTNPDCGPNVPGTYSEFFRNKYQYQPSGHAGARWRCKFAWPSYAVKTLGATKANSRTRVYRGETMELLADLPVYAIDYGETGQTSRPNSEWFDPLTGVALRVEFYVNGKLAMRMRLGSADQQYQGPLKD